MDDGWVKVVAWDRRISKEKGKVSGDCFTDITKATRRVTQTKHGLSRSPTVRDAGTDARPAALFSALVSKTIRIVDARDRYHMCGLPLVNPVYLLFTTMGMTLTHFCQLTSMILPADLRKLLHGLLSRSRLVLSIDSCSWILEEGQNGV